ncbi:homoserine kinase [Virgibacillus phasianinus]|uniref:Homoserine kinase n=1 Tax=Virgibacillus phasianinus TaxID=2017483 RepID=A0A220U6K6_9BACI|nr:homoserine kinase [Virgibacillus phasianinus]ASK63757.1 homoserine kinase [Virgibacillus phasianinus]
MKQFRITVPASSANMGPGFDSIGLALNRRLTLFVKEQGNWEIKNNSEFLSPVTNYEDNFIYQIAKQTAERHRKILPECKITVDSDIPLARGLGSSASAVMAGVELANQLCNLALTNEQKLQYGTDYEGHPDNVAPALFGGIVITAISNNEIEYVQIPAPGLDVVAYIPSVELKTETARRVLPDSLSRKSAAAASATSNLMLASLLTGNYRLAGTMMECDLFHEPYRAELIPNYQSIKREAKKAEAYGTVISGAGPTMISFIAKGLGERLAKYMSSKFPDYEVATLNIDQDGLQVDQQVHSIKSL